MAVEIKMRKIKVPKLFKSVRYSLVTVNSLFLVTSVVLLIAGAVILVQHQVYKDLITQRFFTLPEFVIGTGVVILATSILGFYAAISEQFYFIIAYLALLVIVLIFEIAITITGYQMRSIAAQEIRASMAQSRKLYGTQYDVSFLWDNIQMGFQCCGVEGPTDYPSDGIPVSCCFIDYGSVSMFTCTAQRAHHTSCADALGAWLDRNMFVVAVLALVITVVQIILTLLAAWLAWRSKFEEVELER